MATITADPNPPAYPDWECMTAADHAEHRDWCHSGCATCADHRAWGECVTCGGDTEAVGPDELSRCCGSLVYLGSPVEDNLLALRAA